MPSRSHLQSKLRAYRAATMLLCACAAIAALGLSARPGSAARALAEETSSSAESSATTPAPLPLPLQMARIGNAKQMIIVTVRKLGDKNGTLQFFDYEDGAWVCTLTARAKLGKRGVMDGAHRWAGNKTTPTGMWSMPNLLFGNHARKPAGAKMRYRHITKRSWWSSKRGKTYNKWVEAKRWRGERLYGVVPQYEYAVSTGYNEKPNSSVYGRGSGIFLHVQGKGLTAGCVAVPRADMIRIYRLLDPAKRPAFAVGTLVRGTKTSIWAY